MMMSWTREHCVLVVETFFKTYEIVIATQRAFRVNFMLSRNDADPDRIFKPKQYRFSCLTLLEAIIVTNHIYADI